MKAIIEIPSGSIYKYEMKDGKLLLDRVLSLPYPANYGFVPGTLEADGDPRDIFVISTHPIMPGAELEVKTTHWIQCVDNGVSDDKYVSYIKGDTVTAEYYGFMLKEIEKFLKTYKEGFEVIQCLELI